ncbi:MAG: LLM class F420-dependent oxidoreductase [Acidimicrobiales bacterium]
MNSPRYGVTIPFDGVGLADQREWFAEAADLGYTDLWSSEAGGADAFTPLALAAAWAPGVRLGSAIVPVFTRGPALLAMSVATLAEAAPGRVVVGLGTSSDVIVERWNGIPFERPYQRTRDTVRFLRSALAGQKVDEEYETFTVRGFRLGRVIGAPPPILVAALRPGMLRLAGREGDGAIINWLSADDVRQVVPEVEAGLAARAAAGAAAGSAAGSVAGSAAGSVAGSVADPGAAAGPEIVARIFVCPSADADSVRAMGRFAIAAYLNVPVYAAFHEWLGRGPLLKGMWDSWRAGDRKAAVAAIPDEVVDALVVHGSPEECREHIGRYVESGVTTPVLAILPPPGTGPAEARQALRDLAPR